MFQKYVGIVSGAVQKYVDTNLAKCPFCGETPNWTAAPGTELKSSYPFRCAKCGGLISVPTQAIANPFKIMPENIVVEDAGPVNGNNLYNKTTYSLQFLTASGLKLADTNQIKQDLAADGPRGAASTGRSLPPPPPPLSSASGKRTGRGRKALAALAVLLLLGSAGGAIYGIAANVAAIRSGAASVPVSAQESATR